MSDGTSVSSDRSDESFVLLPSILARLEHLDLSAFVEFKERKVVSSGAYSDVSKHRVTLPNHGKIKVAVKRLRFYMSDDISTVNVYGRI